jgi:hypothetical protein
MFGRVEVQHPPTLKGAKLTQLLRDSRKRTGDPLSAVGRRDETRLSFSTETTSSSRVRMQPKNLRSR